MNVILCDLPERVKGMVVRTFDGDECYTIVLNSKLNREQQLEAYRHELEHIECDDFASDWSVDEIEWVRHIG